MDGIPRSYREWGQTETFKHNDFYVTRLLKFLLYCVAATAPRASKSACNRRCKLAGDDPCLELTKVVIGHKKFRDANIPGVSAVGESE